MSKIYCELFIFVFLILTGTGCTPSVDQEGGPPVESRNVLYQGAHKVIRSIEDWNALGRKEPVRHIVCSGSGALRLITYLECSDKVIAVEQMECQPNGVAPYRIVHPEYGKLPVFGEGHGRDHIEFLLNLNPKPDIIVRIDNPGSGIDPEILQERSGIPVVLISYGDLGQNRLLLDRSLRLLGHILNKTKRAESLIAFFDTQIAEFDQRTQNIPVEKRPTVYLGGLSFRGVHGINSTATSYPPFDWLRLKNPVAELASERIRGYHTMISKEQLVLWNPDYLFVDLGTLSLNQNGGISELQSQAVYAHLDAVKKNRLYGLYPNNSYNTNYAALLANAWFIGSITYPDQFQDVKIDEKINEMFQFMLNNPFMPQCPKEIKSKVYKTIP
ncbi:MAG: ABC transporter substrate-binding protein [Thermoguttaceae bacterium]|nr:ABC transporter substrate-binding protein [Thermoguttaceae bacterium]